MKLVDQLQFYACIYLQGEQKKNLGNFFLKEKGRMTYTENIYPCLGISRASWILARAEALHCPEGFADQVARRHEV